MNDKVARAGCCVARAEADLGVLTAGQRSDLLIDNGIAEGVEEAHGLVEALTPKPTAGAASAAVLAELLRRGLPAAADGRGLMVRLPAGVVKWTTAVWGTWRGAVYNGAGVAVDQVDLGVPAESRPMLVADAIVCFLGSLGGGAR